MQFLYHKYTVVKIAPGVIFICWGFRSQYTQPLLMVNHLFLPIFQTMISRLESRIHSIETTKYRDLDMGLARSLGGSGGRGVQAGTTGMSN